MKSAVEIEKIDIDYILGNLSKEFSELSNSKLLLTGCAGFLGFYIVKSIISWNAKNPSMSISLIACDNFARGKPSWLDEINDKNIVVFEHNVIEKLPEDIRGINYIIHAASIASPLFYRKHPIETMDANVIGLRNLLDHSINNKILKSFLFFSSSEVYGDPLSRNIPTKEDYWGNVSFTGPRACYDESKRYGETLCVNFFQQHDVPVKIARPFNNYGPGLKINDKRVIPDIANNILNNKNIILHSDGSPTRTFCYIADAIIGYIKVLINGANSEAYNIGIEKPEISIKDLAEKMINIARDNFNYEGELEFKNNNDKNYLIDNPNRRCPSIDKAKEIIGFDPNIGLEEGLNRCLLWYYNLGNNVSL